MNEQAIATAKKFLADYDPNMAAYALRDTELARKLDMTNLLWSLVDHGAHINDVQPLIDEMEKANREGGSA